MPDASLSVGQALARSRPFEWRVRRGQRIWHLVRFRGDRRMHYSGEERYDSTWTACGTTVSGPMGVSPAGESLCRRCVHYAEQKLATCQAADELASLAHALQATC